jgi:hypothetical protein
MMELLTLDGIIKAERIMKSMQLVEFPVKHYFSDGTYAREIFIPKGSLLTGRVHKNSDLNIVHYGDMDVMTSHGFKRVGPCTFTAKAGTKQIGYAYEDTLWTTIHATDETDLAVLDRILYEDEGDDTVYDFATGKIKETSQVRDRRDFLEMLDGTPFTPAMVYHQSRNKSDIVNINLDCHGIRVGRSSIQGRGCFAEREISESDCIGPARISGRRTQLGRFINHAKYPNCDLKKDRNGDIYVVPLRCIHMGEEITVDYRQALALAGIQTLK